MDYNEMVQEIVSRVAAYLEKDLAEGEDNRKKLIILTHEHGDICHKGLESPKINECFKTECALLSDFQCDVSSCDAMVLYGLSNSDIARLASGVCDTVYTRIASKALLLGKKVWAVKEEIELLQYCSDQPYGKMMYDKLNLLTDMGLTICSYEELEDSIVNTFCYCEGNTETCYEKPKKQGGDYVCAKRVVTEKDLVAARSEGASRLLTGEKAIITDLAREFAKEHGIEIVKT
ncbi:MAG: hypothetical protein GX025_07080 [Clostridiales bacterium]|nr:hypothetical protein [Clostridiales bacterium]